MPNLITRIAQAVRARANCERSGNLKWFDRWNDRLDRIANEELPSGSGFDVGTTIDLDRCKTGKTFANGSSRIVFRTSFHHMSDTGIYDGWTEHEVIVIPTFGGFDICVTGRDRDMIKEYIAETFAHVLDRPYEWPAE